MIARWMLASMLFALLMGIAALAAERAQRALQRPTRWPWAVALVMALVWPVFSALRPVAPVSAAALIEPLTPVAAQTDWTAVAQAAGSVVDRSKQLDQVLVALWIGASALMFVQIVVGVRALQRVSRQARRARVNGERVLVTETLGPALIGVREPRVVVPEWLLGLDESLQSLVLRHEHAHREARDTILVWLGVAATMLMPWNVALWWMSRRLRLAMEIDCDARTLRGEVEHARYARLLLLIAQRQSAMRFAPMLAESSSHLSRRIAAMRSSPVKHRRFKAALLVAVACVALAVACSPRIAGNLTAPAPVAAPAQTAATEIGAPSVGGDTDPYLESQVQRPAVLRPGTRGPGYPAALRAAGVQGTVLTQFVVNTDGIVDQSSFKVLKSDHPGLGDAVQSQLSTLRFLPAENVGVKVRQLVQQPFVFTLFDDGYTVSIVNPRHFSNVMRPGTAISGTDSMTSRNIMDIDSLVAAGKVTAANAAEFRKIIATHNASVLERRAKVREAAEGPNSATRPPMPAGGQPLYDFQVTRPAEMTVSVRPKYPDLLRSAGIEGQVMAMFVVGEDGRVEMSTFKALRSDNPAFTQAVKEALASTTFTPAELNGKRVKQFVQQPFAFSLSR